MTKQMLIKTWAIAMILLCASSAVNAGHGSFSIIYVDKDAPAGGDGAGWPTAYQNLPSALAAVQYFDEIRVAEGDYTPDPSGLADPREATFRLVKGVTIKGGYAGLGHANPDLRDPDTYVTTLSGDIGTADDNSDNSYHVVTGNEADPNTGLWGFAITRGNADGIEPHNRGGGIFSDGGYAEFNCCKITGNLAEFGGGMYSNQGNPTLNDCTFNDNTSVYGGGMYNRYGSNAILTDCVFEDNSAASYGGGMRNYNSHPSLINGVFTGNQAIYGAGMSNESDSNPTLENCTFADNQATWYGGGMYNYSNSDPILALCTFSENAAGWGGGMFNQGCNPEISGCSFIDNTSLRGGGVYNQSCGATFSDCLFEGNSTSGANNKGGGMRNWFSYTKVLGCTFIDNQSNWGGGMANLDSDPTVSNCLFSRNTALDCGGGIYNYLSDPVIINCTLADNTANQGYVVIADAAKEFSGIQGENNWRYGYYDGDGGDPFSAGDFEELTLFDGNWKLPGYKTSLWSDGGHPNYDPEHWAVRRWESEVNGQVLISLRTRKNQTGGGDGVYVRLLVDGTEVWSQYVAYNDGFGIEDRINVNVNMGSLVDFAIDPIANDAYDSSRFSIIIKKASSGGGGLFSDSSNSRITNTILWQNLYQGAANLKAQVGGMDPAATYCCIQGWSGGGLGNINFDPFFVDPALGDYHLKSAGWRWDIIRQRWDSDGVTSRCIDSGNPGALLSDELLTIPDDPTHDWGINLRKNMGAYGGTSEASMGPHGWALLADLTNDGIVNLADYALQVKDWQKTAADLPGDLNRDGVVNILDLSLKTRDWLKLTIWH